MARPRNAFRTVGVLGAAALVAAGCGGGDAATTSTPPTTPSTPSGTDGSATVSDPANPGQDLDGDGTPDADLAAAGTDLGATASIPSLDGDQIGGGLDSTEASPVFSARAITESGTDSSTDPLTPTVPTVTTPAVGSSSSSSSSAVRYSGAKISIDGVVHDVNRNGTFPEGSPAFRLLAVRGGSIEIELIAGEFTAGGGSGVVLDKGEEVSLVNASEQVTYRVTYLRPIQDDSSGF